jgi:hypothetical protein
MQDKNNPRPVGNVRTVGEEEYLSQCTLIKNNVRAKARYEVGERFGCRGISLAARKRLRSGTSAGRPCLLVHGPSSL